jgi:hypothetical protein
MYLVDFYTVSQSLSYQALANGNYGGHLNEKEIDIMNRYNIRYRKGPPKMKMRCPTP